MQPRGSTLLAVLCVLAGALHAVAVGTAAQSSLRGAPQQVAPNATVPASAPHRARLDVGFASFEKDAVDMVARSINSSLRSSGWSDELRAKVAQNVTALLHAALQTQLKPLKQSIGKTWMVLPQEVQKDKYVEQVRDSFASTLAGAAETIGKHANTSLKYLVVKQGDDLVQKASVTLATNILEDHCYKEVKASPAHKAAKLASAKPAAAKPAAAKPAAVALLDDAEAPPGQFCIPSVVHSLLRRLNDSENLVGMTMKFEARALAMVQEQHLEAKTAHVAPTRHQN